jgi:dUTP pyrophosphatase
MQVNIKKLHPRARIPTYGSDGAACFDLYALIEEAGETAVLPCEVETIRTGLSFEIPTGYCMNIYGRSGLAAKFGVTLANSVGKIDSDYRGEVIILLTSSAFPLIVRDGDRIAQAEIVPIERVTCFNVVDALTDTARGSGGLGNTGL